MEGIELDERGLRIFDTDGHRLCWPGAVEGQDYRRSGLDGGVCTVGHTWDQDAARSSAAHPGRLRHGGRPCRQLSGVGSLRAEWLSVPGQPPRLSTEITCRGGHRLQASKLEQDFASALVPLPDPIDGENSHSFKAKLIAFLDLQGWSYVDRIECPDHRAEREALAAQLEVLRAMDLAEGRLQSSDLQAPTNLAAVVA